MHHDEADTGGYAGWRDGRPTLRWQRLLGSTASAQLLTELVVERLRVVTESDPLFGGAGVIEVDAELGVVGAPDRGWSATLAPLAARLAHMPPDGWSTMVDREIERWRRAVTGVERPVPGAPSGPVPPDSASIVLRLTTAGGPPARALRPAFGNTDWELVRDLGRGGWAVQNAGPDDAGLETEDYWDRIAAQTVARSEQRWAHLTLDGTTGVVLSGPHVSALLYRPDRLRDQVDRLGRAALQVVVISNSLMLITACDQSAHPRVDLVAESLRRFASASRRHFEPFAVQLPETNTSSCPTTPE